MSRLQAPVRRGSSRQEPVGKHIIMNGPDQVVITHMDVFGSVDAGPDDPLADVVAVVVDGHDTR
ncbi:hypothetical protein [Streptomyces sp. NPDC005568]|uniref:hypothetical protein n=1 Tax=Streptomyces sp. NPDC005568 TaxID=3156887 RepID=UPI0033A2604F